MGEIGFLVWVDLTIIELGADAISEDFEVGESRGSDAIVVGGTAGKESARNQDADQLGWMISLFHGVLQESP